MTERYKVVIAQSAKMDIMKKKRYIIDNFKYRDYAQNFSAKIKKANSNHLLFYTADEEKKVVTILRVLQDGMDWEYIVGRWIETNV